MGELCVDTSSPFLWLGWGWRRVGATGWIRSEPSMRLAAGVLFAWGLVPAGGCAAGFLQAARRAAGGSAAVRRGQGGERCGTAGAALCREAAREPESGQSAGESGQSGAAVVLFPAAAHGDAEAGEGHADLLARGDDVELGGEPGAFGGGDVEEVRLAGVVHAQGEFGGFFAGGGGFCVLRELVGEFGVLNQAFFHFGKGGQDDFAVVLHGGEGGEFGLGDVFVEGGAVEQDGGGRGAEVPGGVAEEVGKVGAGAGTGAAGQREAGEEVGDLDANVGDVGMQVIFGADDVRPAAQQLGGEVGGDARDEVVDGGGGHAQFGELVDRGAKVGGQGVLTGADLGLQAGDGGAGVRDGGAGFRDGQFVLKALGFARDGDAVGALLVFELLLGDAQAFFGGDPLEVGGGDVAGECGAGGAFRGAGGVQTRDGGFHLAARFAPDVRRPGGGEGAIPAAVRGGGVKVAAVAAAGTDADLREEVAAGAADGGEGFVDGDHGADHIGIGQVGFMNEPGELRVAEAFPPLVEVLLVGGRRQGVHPGDGKLHFRGAGEVGPEQAGGEEEGGQSGGDEACSHVV